jgi:hypothetical protein
MLLLQFGAIHGQHCRVSMFVGDRWNLLLVCTDDDRYAPHTCDRTEPFGTLMAILTFLYIRYIVEISNIFGDYLLLNC